MKSSICTRLSLGAGVMFATASLATAQTIPFSGTYSGPFTLVDASVPTAFVFSSLQASTDSTPSLANLANNWLVDTTVSPNVIYNGAASFTGTAGNLTGTFSGTVAPSAIPTTLDAIVTVQFTGGTVNGITVTGGSANVVAQLDMLTGISSGTITGSINGPCIAGINSNNSTLNNGGDVVFLYSSPSSGFTAAANPPDVTGDWYYKVWKGNQSLNHVTALGSVMEVDGFYESLFDTFWGTIGSPASSAADFYERTLGPALPSVLNPGIFEPAFVTLGFTTETLVIVGNSGFGNPCTVAPSLCSPPGSTCPPTGFVNGYLIELNFSSTCGTGVVLPADGTSLSDTALTYFVNGGMTATGGVCGLGDYGLQDVHSTDETQRDDFGGVNPDGGFQLGGGGPLAEAVVSMLEANLTFRDRTLNLQANTGGAGVETGDNGGGATNAVRLDTSSGLSTLGIEFRSLADSTVPNLTVTGFSLTPIPNPGVPVFGGQANLLVVPDGVFNATAVPGAVAPTVFVFTSEGAYTGPQFPLPPLIPTPGVPLLYGQGVTVDLNTFTFGSSGVVTCG